MIRGRFRQNWTFHIRLRAYCNRSDETDVLGKENKVPTNSKDYADALTEHFKDGGKNAVAEIEKNVNDDNIKAYLMHELRMKNKPS